MIDTGLWLLRNMMAVMTTQYLAIKVQQGKTRSSLTVEIPTDAMLVAAALELRLLGKDKVPAAGRYGACIGAYFPQSTYSLTEVDPFTGLQGDTLPGGTIPERCVFFYGSGRVVADTQFETDPPRIYYYGKRVPAPDPGLFEVPTLPTEEGELREVIQSEYERNSAIRALCIRAHGNRCLVCGVSFAEAYGSAAAGIIHVHHLEPLGMVRQSHIVNPLKDMIPVCPNCHAVIHRRTPPFTPDEVRSMLRQKPSSS